MKITVLGTRGEIEESAPYHSKKSGVLIDDTLLLDMGDKRFLAYNPKALLITHLHPDHAYFVRHEENPRLPFPLFAPESYDEVPISLTKKPFTLLGYDITPIPTIHSIKVKSNAYLIAHNGKRILYTGDLIWIEKKYHHLFKNLDLVITEASFMRKGGMIRREKDSGKIYGHTGVPDLINLFKYYTDTMLLVHFGAWFYKDMKQAKVTIKKLAQENGIQIIAGYDGLKLEL
jgi:ribonuclease BN (tRNA processing enzyme)